MRMVNCGCQAAFKNIVSHSTRVWCKCSWIVIKRHRWSTEEHGSRRKSLSCRCMAMLQKAHHIIKSHKRYPTQCWAVQSVCAQCWINSSSKCSKSYGPRVLGALQSFVSNVFVICKGGYYDLGAPGKPQKRGCKFCTCNTEASFAESKLNISFCLGMCFCMLSPFFIANSLK